MKVFIGYSSEDGKGYAKNLYEVLDRRGHDPCLAEHDISVSENIWDEIVKENLMFAINIIINFFGD